ncbi:MAG: EAL domain-containing protein [Ahrensia sp.]
MSFQPSVVSKQDSADAYKSSDGTWVADRNGVTLRSAFQPIFCVRNERFVPVAAEGLLRVFHGSERVATGSFFKGLANHKRDEIESLTRTMHIRNAQFLAPSMRRLFVNFDPSVLGSPSRFESTLANIGRELLRTEIAPGNVVCEITEQKAFDTVALKEFVYMLRARGYLVAVDDFGAQSSNLERVAALTPDIVKLDGRMVQQKMADPQGFFELKRMIEQFKHERIQVVLEGIQKSWQLILATKTKADFYQGFALAVPRIAPAKFPEWEKISSRDAVTGAHQAVFATK